MTCARGQYLADSLARLREKLFTPLVDKFTVVSPRSRSWTLPCEALRIPVSRGTFSTRTHMLPGAMLRASRTSWQPCVSGLWVLDAGRVSDSLRGGPLACTGAASSGCGDGRVVGVSCGRGHGQMTGFLWSSCTARKSGGPRPSPEQENWPRVFEFRGRKPCPENGTAL